MEDIITRMPATELAAVCICAVIVILRLFMKKLPAKYSYCLWAILLTRLLMPFTISSAVSMFNLSPDVSEIFASDSVGREVQEAPQAENDIPAPAVVYDVHNGVYTQGPAHNGTAPISVPAGDSDTKPL
ncbi:MAG: hypothetical protein J6X85_03025 [Ruminococcus sp.]|nr:hypothetical protein [Ruminococcus sp.]